MRETRKALLIGTSRYTERRWPRLDACEQDVEVMRSVLRDTDLGGYEVTASNHVLVNKPYAVVKRTLEKFLKQANSSDALLVYLSGHADLDRTDESLFFPLCDSDLAATDSTALAANDLLRWLASARASEIVVIIDACYAARLPKGLPTEFGSRPGKRISILAASGADQPADTHDPGRLYGADGPSPYTRHLVQGIRSGHASDGSGLITDRSLHAYLVQAMADLPQRPELHQQPSSARGLRIALDPNHLAARSVAPMPARPVATARPVRCEHRRPLASLFRRDAYERAVTHKEYVTRPILDSALDQALDPVNRHHVVLTTGAPLSGRSRSLLEAASRRHPDAHVHVITRADEIQAIRDKALREDVPRGAILRCLEDADQARGTPALLWIPEVDRFMAPGLVDDDFLAVLEEAGAILLGTSDGDGLTDPSGKRNLVTDTTARIREAALTVAVPAGLEPSELEVARRTTPGVAQSLGNDGDGKALRRRFGNLPTEVLNLVRLVAGWQALGGARPLPRSAASELWEGLQRSQSGSSALQFEQVLDKAGERTERGAQLLSEVSAPPGWTRYQAHGVVVHPVVLDIVSPELTREDLLTYDEFADTSDRLLMAYQAHQRGWLDLAVAWWSRSWEDGEVDAARAAMRLTLIDQGRGEATTRSDGSYIEPAGQDQAFNRTSLATQLILSETLTELNRQPELDPSSIALLRQIVERRQSHWWPLAAQLVLLALLSESGGLTHRPGPASRPLDPATISTVEALADDEQFGGWCLAAHRTAVLVEQTARSAEPSSSILWHRDARLLAVDNPFRLDAGLHTALELAAREGFQAAAGLLKEILRTAGAGERAGQQPSGSRLSKLVRDRWPQVKTTRLELEFLAEYFAGKAQPDPGGGRIKETLQSHLGEAWAEQQTLWVAAQAVDQVGGHLSEGHRTALTLLVMRPQPWRPAFAIAAFRALARDALEPQTGLAECEHAVMLAQRLAAHHALTPVDQQTVTLLECELFQRLSRLFTLTDTERARKHMHSAIAAWERLNDGHSDLPIGPAEQSIMEVRLALLQAVVYPVQTGSKAFSSAVRAIQLAQDLADQGDDRAIREVTSPTLDTEVIPRLIEHLGRGDGRRAVQMFLNDKQFGEFCLLLARSRIDGAVSSVHRVVVALCAGIRNDAHPREPSNRTGLGWLGDVASTLGERAELVELDTAAAHCAAAAESTDSQAQIELFNAAAVMWAAVAGRTEEAPTRRSAFENCLQNDVRALLPLAKNTQLRNDELRTTLEQLTQKHYAAAQRFWITPRLDPQQTLTLARTSTHKNTVSFWLDLVRDSMTVRDEAAAHHAYRLGLRYYAIGRYDDATKAFRDVIPFGDAAHRAAARHRLGWRNAVSAKPREPGPQTDLDDWMRQREAAPRELSTALGSVAAAASVLTFFMLIRWLVLHHWSAGGPAVATATVGAVAYLGSVAIKDTDFRPAVRLPLGFALLLAAAAVLYFGSGPVTLVAGAALTLFFIRI